ncbi:MAG TPA: response regulator transcription factor [Clostridia bacterium]|nr:response regulator transcription factor [Clostridia bacterium]
MYKLLIIEDDVKLQELLKAYLERYEYYITTITDFKDIDGEFEAAKPDLVLLDINLPYLDGYYVCKAIRRKSHVPIIIISARSEDMEQILGMECGADDYIVKPLNTAILLSKVKALLRRSSGEYSRNSGENPGINGFSLDEGSFRLYWNGRITELSKNEFKLIRKLMENRDRIVSREELLQELWDESTFVDDNTLTVNVTRIRSILSDLGLNEIIRTKRGAGYIFDSSMLNGDPL